MIKYLLFATACMILLSSRNALAQPADAQLYTFSSPVNQSFCPGVLPISINVFNNDIIDITEITLSWNINTVAQSPVTWTGTLAAGASTSITLSPAFNFLSGNSYDIEVTIQTVNTLPDPNTSNDYTLVTFFPYQVFAPLFYWNGCELECLNESDYISLQWFKDGLPDPAAPSTGLYRPTQSGTYSLVGLTFDSCDAAADTSIFVNPPMWDITSLGLAEFCAGDSVALVFAASEPVTFMWNTGSSADTIYATMGGWYSVIGTTDANFCLVEDSFQVTEFPSPQVNLSLVNDTLVSTFSGLHEWYLNGSVINGAHDSTYVPMQSGSYYCIVTNVYGCTAVSDTIDWIFPLVGFDAASETVLLYPNPAHDRIYIRLNNPTGTVTMKIFDSVGRLALIQAISGTEETVFLNALKDGVYQVVFDGEKFRAQQKLVVTQ